MQFATHLYLCTLWQKGISYMCNARINRACEHVPASLCRVYRRVLMTAEYAANVASRTSASGSHLGCIRTSGFNHIPLARYSVMSEPINDLIYARAAATCSNSRVGCLHKAPLAFRGSKSLLPDVSCLLPVSPSDWLRNRQAF